MSVSLAVSIVSRCLEPSERNPQKNVRIENDKRIRFGICICLGKCREYLRCTRLLQNAYQKIEITEVKKISLRWTHDTSSSVNGNGLTAYERSVCGCQEGDHFGNLVNPAHSAQRVTFLAARQIALSYVASIFLCSNFLRLHLRVKM